MRRKNSMRAALAGAAILATSLMSIGASGALAAPSAHALVPHLRSDVSSVSTGQLLPCPNPIAPDPITTTTVPGTSPAIIATLVTTHTLDGAVDTQRIPPVGWQPATASAAELDYFGVPARPTGGQALADWNDEWIDHFSAIAPLTECEALAGASAATATQNWGGVVSQASPITEVYGHTTFNPGTPCATGPDSYTNWVGIGGYGVTPLLQNGFWTDSNFVPGSELFYEAIGPINTGVFPVYPTTGSINRGDSVNISTTYSSGQAVFAWHDLTTGTVYSITRTQFNGYPASDFYNGSTGEAIDERGKINIYTTLRNYGTDNWSNVKVATNGGALTNFRLLPHIGLDMIDNGYTYSQVSEPSGDTGTFTDTWRSCGVTG